MSGAAQDTADGFVEACPMCGSPFDNRVHTLEECVECAAEASTACCVSDGVCTHCNQEN